MPGEINLAKQWLTKAQNDLLNADNNLAAPVYQIKYISILDIC